MLGVKAEKQLRNKKKTEDWATGCHPRDNRNSLELTSNDKLYIPGPSFCSCFRISSSIVNHKR